MKRVKRRAVGKRCDVDTDIVLYKPSITVNKVLERVMSIFIHQKGTENAL